MSKFYKTSFAFHQSLLSKNLESKEDLQNINLGQRKNKNLWKLHNKHSDQDHLFTQIKKAVSKKIQIDPMLLFNNKNSLSGNYNHPTCQINQKIQNKLQRMNQTSSQRFYQNTQRPQAKKSSRIRIWSSSKRNQMKEILNRPQTSKCQRRTTQKVETNNEEFQGRILLNSRVQKDKSRTHSLSNGNTTKSALQTSLDPQFLALFAN